jgi:ligand-binding sensor domain-containing protein
MRSRFNVELRRFQAIVGRAVRIVCVSCLALVHPLLAQEQTLSQMTHKSWTAKDGAPQDIKTIAQGKDGTLWIGTPAGLFNFDGLVFTQFRSPLGQPELPSPSVKSLLVSRDGALWVGMRQAGAARIFHGQVMLYSKYKSGKLISQILNLREAPDGKILAIGNNSRLVSLLDHGEVQIEPSPSGLENQSVNGFFYDSRGSLWESSDKKLYKRDAGQSRFVATNVAADLPMDFAEMSDGTLWMTDFDFVRRLERRQHFDKQGNVRSVVYDTPMIYATFRMPDDSMLMSVLYKGLQHVSWADHVAYSKIAEDPKTETFRNVDSLSSDYVETLFRDAAGNIWSGGLKGLDRFTTARLTRFIPQPVGRPSIAVDWQVCTNPLGDVWVANTDQQMYSITEGSVRTVSNSETVDQLLCGRNGDVWAANASQIWNGRSGKLEAVRNFVPG